MIFGKIEYLNLLLFDIFIKKEPFAQPIKKSIKKSNPAQITEMFIKRKVSAAFISSIKSVNQKSLNVGIVARGEILSVLSIKKTKKYDNESKTSNILAQVLGIDGEIIIGDKALKEKFSGIEATDLALIWIKKYNLPFVFAKFCYNSNSSYYKKLMKKFISSNNKIPYYIKKDVSIKKGFTHRQIDFYLSKVSYKIDTKAKMGLDKFLYKAKRIKQD